MYTNEWLDLFFDVHYNTKLDIVRIEWPNGKSLLEQDNILVSIFRIIREQLRKEKNNG